MKHRFAAVAVLVALLVYAVAALGSASSSARASERAHPQYHRLIKLSGNGIENSRPIRINSPVVTVVYTYDCSSFGSSGNFIIDIQTLSGSDDMIVVNTVGLHGKKIVYGYPKARGSLYYSSVNSECYWAMGVLGY
jgi:hypothetical protein